MVAYNDYFIGPYADQDPPDDGVDDGWTGAPLKPEIDVLIDARRNYAGGTTTYLSTMNTNDLFIAKRNGFGPKPGCILVINDNTTQALSDTNVLTGWPSTTLVDVIDTNHTVTTAGNGVATLNASSRFYRVYVRQSDLQ